MVNQEITITEDLVWSLLNQIPDPDIPAISIVDLGIVRKVELIEQSKVVVTITPTYSGCPAMDVFKIEIIALLKENGVNEVELKIAHFPTWTTDWLSDATKQKMKQYGIAPPETSCNHHTDLFSNDERKITCPHCNNNNQTALTSQFSSTPCKALWYCNCCQQPFEYFKCF